MATLGVRGGLSVDHLVRSGHGARFGELGGPGFFAALGARLVSGVDVRISTALPADEPRFAELFDRLGIDRRYCTEVDAATRLWILDSDEGRRIVETAPAEIEIEGAATPREETEQPLDPRFLLGLDALLDSAPLRRAPVEAGTAVGIDPHQGPMRADPIGSLRNVTPPGGIVLPSRVQLSLVDPDARAAARRIADELDVSVIARLDREGMLVVEAGRRAEWIVRDDEVQVRETTGAGDASAAAIMAAIALGADLVTAAMSGVTVARIALADWGAAALLRAEPFLTPPSGVTAQKER